MKSLLSSLWALAFIALAAPVLARADAQSSAPGAGPAAPPAPMAAIASGPKIQFATQIGDFGKVDAGDPVKFTYVFTNAGDSVLELSNVRPSCGCTTTGEWTRRVDPGQTGTIPIELNTSVLSGPVTKGITVTCNDPAQPTVSLQLRGTVWKPVEVIPPLAFLRVPEDSPTNVSVSLRLINHMEAPLVLFPPQSETPTFTAELATNQPGKEFRLIVKAIPPLSPGAVTGKIHVKTSATNVPEITVPVLANLVKAATATNSASPGH